MIQSSYKRALVNLVNQIDALLGESNLERFVLEVVHNKQDSTILELMKTISILNKQHNIRELKEKLERLVETLYTYLGAVKVDEIFANYKEAATHISLDELEKQLNELIGLAKVKQQVNDLIIFNQIQQLRVKQGLKRSHKTLHMAFLGNPGTAKTTVARIIGRMYKEIGLLSKGHFIEASRTDLIAEYQGQTAIKVKNLINRAKGGVLFIDEAYSLTENERTDSYGRESLTELTKALEDYRDDLVVIVAGYPDLMDEFFHSNPGLKSRFNTFIYFDDYSLEELVQIFLYICEKNDYKIDENAIEKIRKLLNIHLENKDEHFANGRLARNLFDDIIMNQAKRIAQLEGKISNDTLMFIIKEDVPEQITIKSDATL